MPEASGDSKPTSALSGESPVASEVQARVIDAMESSPIATMCVSAVVGRYLFVNRAYEQLLGRPRAELLSRDAYEIWLEVTHPDDTEPERQAIERVARGELDGYHLEKRLVHAGGHVQWVLADAHASRDAEGRLESLTVYFTDIQERRAEQLVRESLQAQLLRAQKLSALGNLAGGMAHDFNNRLLIIMGHAELLKRSLATDSPHVHHVDMVLSSAQRAAELTHQLLAYSRRQVLKPVAFDLNHTVDRMRRMLERLIGEDINLVTALRAAHPVFCDPGQVEQIILNLVLNARDAMHGGGRLALETQDRLVETAEDPLQPGCYVDLVVRDTGVGIPDDVLPRIFEPFFTTKGVGQGTGLGLAMVEGIASQSGGAVRVATSPGEGTAITVTLPRADGIPVAPRYSARTAPPISVPSETVLVCDDDDEVRELLTNLLKFRAYEVLHARNGHEALEVVRMHRGELHLLVTDLVMPELGGVELARRLRESHPELRVLFISGYTENASTLGRELGVDAQFLAKPFLPGELTRMVCALLERRSGEEPAAP